MSKCIDSLNIGAPFPNPDASLFGCIRRNNIIYGVRWDSSNPATECERIEAHEDYNNGQGSQPGFGDDPSFMPAGSFPVQDLMRRCVVDDDLNVVYYLDPEDSEKKANGDPANIDGTDGQVMVEVPKHYRRIYKSGNYHYYKISLSPFSNAVKINKKYFSAYEGYVDGSNKLCSISGVMPTTNKYIYEYRQYARNRGDSRWCQQNYYSYLDVAILYLIEYADWNIQDKIGEGATNASSTDWNNYNGYNPVVHTGRYSNQLGNQSGSVEFTLNNFVGGIATLTSHVISYRGIENIFGHIWKFIDGLNIHNNSVTKSRAFICDDPANFLHDTQTNYELAGLLAETDGYWKDHIEGHLLPSSTGGSSATYIPDYYYTYYDNDPNSGWKIALWGGPLNDGVRSGLAYLSAYDGSGTRYASIGSRLCAIL